MSCSVRLLFVSLLSTVVASAGTSAMAAGAAQVLSSSATDFSSVTSGTLALHLKADAANVSTTGSLVDQWSDISGNGNHFLGSGGTRPTFVTSGLNGRGAIDFGAAGTHQLSVVGGHGLGSSSALPFTFFAVTSGTTNPRALFDSAPGSPDVFRFYPDNDVELWSNNPSVALTTDSAGSVISVRGSTSGSNRALEVREINGDGVFNLTSGMGIGNTDPVLFTNPDIGTINGGSAGTFGGAISELVLFEGALTDQDRDFVEQVLGFEFGVGGFSNPFPEVPEPSTWALFALALGGVGGWHWLRRRRSLL